MLRITDVAQMARMNRAEIEKMISRGWYKPRSNTSRGRWRQYDGLDVVFLSTIRELRSLGFSSQDAARYVNVELRHELQRSMAKPITSWGWYFFIAHHGDGAKHSETVGMIETADFNRIFNGSGLRSVILIDVARIIADVSLMIAARQPGGMPIRAAAEVIMRYPRLRRALTNTVPPAHPRAPA
ncbi:MAG: MerR family transcriptional regulator [Hyphomicrobiaceae bacterium]